MKSEGAKRLVKVSADDRAVVFFNSGMARVFLGKSSRVTFFNGYPIPAGTTLTLENTRSKRHPRGDLTGRCFYALPEVRPASVAIMVFKRGRKKISECEIWETRGVNL